MKRKMRCSIVRMFGMFECGRLMRSIIMAALCALGLAMATEAQEVKPVLFAKDVRVEQRFPWTNLVDVCFTVTNTLESAKNTNVIAQVRAFYDESKALGVTNLHFASENGQPDLSKKLTDGKVTLALDADGKFQQVGLKPNEVRLVWDAKADVPPEAEWIKTLRFTVALGLTAKEAEDADAAASRTAWLDVRTDKVYQFEDTIPVSHSAGNWANQPSTKQAQVGWNSQSRRVNLRCTDDVPLTATLDALGKYEIGHQAADRTRFDSTFTVVKRQLGTEFEPWIVSEEGKDEVRAIMRSETELCIEGDGTTMAKFMGGGPWDDKVESVYFANKDQQVSADAFAGCTNLRVVMTKGETDDLRTQLENAGADVEKIKFVNLSTSALVEFVSVSNDKGRAKICCVVYDRDAASKEYGSNVKLKLTASKTVKHLHRLENGIEYDDMMLWQKTDGRPQFVTLIWDAKLDGVNAAVTAADVDVSGTLCENATVKVNNGNFVGVLDKETSIRTWKGIPYAKQPTGTDRWKKMGDPKASTDTFAAKQFGHAAIQRLDPGETGGYIEQGDDCLVLNVWSTDEKEDVGPDYGKRPVMVYIHGGAFVLGGSADIHYDGRNIVERNKDVVVVTINYRVGLLGFADLKNVPGSDKDDGFRNTAKLAILDQRQALIWVQNNIAAFGGDKDNVTIFGESAGGTSVAIHMTSPESKDLFKRAIQMSGALDLTMTEKSYDNRRLVPELVAAVAKLRFGDVSKTNYVDMTLLQTLTVDEIRNLMLATADAQKTDKDGLSWPAWDLPADDITGGECVLNSFLNFPICDDVRGSVPTDPFRAFAENGVANGKDYMVGTTRNEMRYFMGYDGPDDPLRTYYTGFLADRQRLNKVWFGKENEDLITKFIDVYEDDDVRDEMDTRYPGIWKRTALEDQLYMRLPAIKMAEIHAGLSKPESGKKGKTYMYRFDKRRELADQPWAKAGHACELDYAFGNTSIAEYGPIDDNLADAVNAAFVNFARCGDPNGEGDVGGETWEEYDTTARKTMLFKNDCTTSLAEDPEQVARKTFLDSGAYDTYHEARADTECRTKIDVPFVRDEDAVPTGTAAGYWQVGKTVTDNVIAFTNAAGRLFVEGKGDIRDFYALGGGLWFNKTTTEVEFGPDVKSIGANMLANCSMLRTIAMYPDTPPTLGEDALPGILGLTIYVQEESVGDYKAAWPEYADVIVGVKLGSKELPWKVGVQLTDTVAACTNGLGRLEIIGDGVMMGFGESAPWASDDLTEAVVGAGVTTFGKNAFANCKGLKTLAVFAEEPPTLGIGNDLAGVKIFVPAGKAETYRAKAQWMASKGTIDEMCTEKGDPLTKHLYEMTYNWWDATKANDVGEGLADVIETIEWLKELYGYFFPYETFDWYEDLGVIPSALCTSCRNGNFVGRNFDWGYDDVDECVMHVPAAEGRLASVGVASWFFPKWLQDLVDVDAFLPELTMDGVNEKGVAINVNVVPGGDNGWTTGTNPGGKRLCAGFAVRTVLDNATSAAHAVEILQSRDIYSLKPLEFHWMISDADESYVVECVSNELVVLKAKNAQPKMANFYVSHSPSVGEYEVVSDNAELTKDTHTPHAMGIERYANVSNGLESVESVKAMFTHMSNVWYKAKYLPGNEKKYWSDLNGSPVPGKDGERFAFGDGLDEARRDAFRRIQANYVAVTNYEARWKSRDTLEHDPSLTNQVVHTVHTSVYDIEKRMLRVVVQEDAAHAFDISLMPGAEYSPWEVGGDDEDPTKVVGAWTNGTELVIEGSGTVTNLAAISSKIKDGTTAITIKAGVTGAAPGVFAGLGNFNLTLPDGWQGELPDDKGNWYGATGVELAKWPLTVRNVKFQQRYPWNGLVDVSCDLSGAGEVTLSATVLTNGVKFIEAKTLIGETTFDLDAAGGVTNGVKFIWNAAADLPAGFKAQGVQLKVTAEK